jgi:hypothetical protein
MKIKVTSVSYDTDGDPDLEKTLPQTMGLEVDDQYYNDDPDDCVADAISDHTGFCVYGFTYEVI